MTFLIESQKILAYERVLEGPIDTIPLDSGDYHMR